MGIASIGSIPWRAERVRARRSRVIRFPAITRRETGRGRERRGRPVEGGVQLDEATVRSFGEGARRGEGAALDGLFRTFEADVTRLCHRLLGSREDAEDATAETFLKVQRGLDSYDPERRFRTWLLSVAAHHALDRLRRRTTERRIFHPSEADLEAATDPGPSPLRGELDAERRARIQTAIESLPNRYRAPIVLRYYADLEYEEIANALDITRNQVATLLFRGRRRLRELLADEDPS